MKKFSLENDMSFLSAAELRQMQERLLNEHIAYCRANSPYYRDVLKDYPADPVSLEDLARFPLTTKYDLASRNDDFIAVPTREISDICFTSGTTGTPCRVVYSRNDLDRLAYNDATGFRAAGLTAEDTVLLTCTIDRCFVAGLAYYSGVIKLGAAAVRNGLNTLESHAEVIVNAGVTAIVGVPSFLAKLGQYLVDNGIEHRGIRHLICIGEPLRTRDMNLTPLGMKLNKIWPDAAYSTFASTEIATSFTECSAHCGGHPPADLAIVEIVDESGRPLPPGEVGEVAVTPLQVEAMPLLRFKTGDVGFLLPDACGCGRSTPRLGPILGRKSQMLKVRGTTLFPNAFFNVLDRIDGIDNYYMEVSGAALSDEIDIYISFRSGDMKSLRVEEMLYGANRLHANLHTLDCDTVRKKVFGTSRKPIRFFDLRERNW